jgi:hypothetical protein
MRREYGASLSSASFYLISVGGYLTSSRSLAHREKKEKDNAPEIRGASSPQKKKLSVNEMIRAHIS